MLICLYCLSFLPVQPNTNPPWVISNPMDLSMRHHSYLVSVVNTPETSAPYPAISSTKRMFSLDRTSCPSKYSMSQRLLQPYWINETLISFNTVGMCVIFFSFCFLYVLAWNVEVTTEDAAVYLCEPNMRADTQGGRTSRQESRLGVMCQALWRSSNLL